LPLPLPWWRDGLRHLSADGLPAESRRRAADDGDDEPAGRDELGLGRVGPGLVL